MQLLDEFDINGLDDAYYLFTCESPLCGDRCFLNLVPFAVGFGENPDIQDAHGFITPMHAHHESTDTCLESPLAFCDLNGVVVTGVFELCSSATVCTVTPKRNRKASTSKCTRLSRQKLHMLKTQRSC
jgi:hypothetical protein